MKEHSDHLLLQEDCVSDYTTQTDLVAKTHHSGMAELLLVSLAVLCVCLYSSHTEKWKIETTP